MNSISKPLEYKDGWPVKPLEPPKGMLAEVTILRRRGAKLSLEESKATAKVCLIRYRRNLDDSGMAYRFRSQVELLEDRTASGGAAGAPLFDPYVEDWTDKGIIVSGWEINPAEGGEGTAQHYQVWLVKPLAMAPR